MPPGVEIEASRPPQDSELVARWAVEAPDQLSALRADLGRTLRETGAPPSGGLTGVADQMVLVASELATNAILHGLPPTIVQLMTTGEEFVLDVIDHAPSAAPEVATDRAPGEGGLGLQIAKRMAMNVAWFSEGRAKHVWARFPGP
ncbi:hypothetical protein GCM10023169_01570 [Georgenia halophila]|uniref:Histidine kinase/HSP90-like ATPase domain-containing protein n=1 Tax=Georgenia halophila TaxID=620889 RepID=A0ABP8KU04_9MICO